MLNFGTHIDFNMLGEDSTVSAQFRSQGILFGKAASSLATNTVVRIDYSRGPGCTHVLNGDPEFSGWEFFIFVDPAQSKWAAGGPTNRPIAGQIAPNDMAIMVRAASNGL